MKREHIILIIALILIASSIYYLEGQKVRPVIPTTEPGLSSQIQTGEETEINESEIIKIEKPPVKNDMYRLSPELVGLTGYLNGAEEGIQISDYEGKIVLIDFWTYTCINCIRTLPHLTAWDEKYRDKGLVIIGIHTPEFEFEKETANVQEAIDRYGIKYMVVQDNDYRTWTNFRNRFWPRNFLIDSEGYIRYDHIGEGGYEETERMIRELLAETGENITEMETTGLEDQTPRFFGMTPELYGGYKFANPRDQTINEESFREDKLTDYTLPDNIEKDQLYLDGNWLATSENLRAQDDEEASIVLKFTAKSVNIVADSIGKPTELEVFINDQYISKETAGDDVQFDGKRAFILIDEPKLYNIFNGDFGVYTLKLKTDSKDFLFNAFTFG